MLKKSLKQFEQSIKSCVIRYSGYLSEFMVEKVVVGLQTSDSLGWTTFNRLPVSSEGVTSAKLKHRMHLVYFFIITPSPPSSFPSDKLSFPSFPKLWLLELEQPAKQEKNFIDAYSPHQMTFSLWIIIIDIIISSALPPR